MGVSGKKRGDRGLGRAGESEAGGTVSIGASTGALIGAVWMGAGRGMALRRARLAGVWASGVVTGGSLGIAANVLREKRETTGGGGAMGEAMALG